MFDRFVYDSRRVTVIAQESARALSHNYIGTEHLLLALLTPGTATARIMAARGADYEGVRQAVIDLIGRGLTEPEDTLRFSDNGRRVLIRSADVPGQCVPIVPEHILLALLGEERGVGWDALKKVGADTGGAAADLHEIIDPARDITDPDEAVGVLAASRALTVFDLASAGSTDRQVRLEAIVAAYSSIRARGMDREKLSGPIP